MSIIFPGTRRRAHTAISGNATRRKRPATRRPRAMRRKKRTKRKRTTKGASIVQLKRRVTKIARGLASNQGTLTHRQLHVSTFTVPQYQAAFFQQVLSSIVRLEGVLTAVPMYDSSSTSVVSNDFTSKTTQMAFNFDRTVVKTAITNRNKGGIVLTAGYMTVNDDTINGPLAAWNAGLVDGSLTATDPLLRLSDSQVLQDLWHFVPGSRKQVTLSPGGRLDISTVLGQFTYQRATADADLLSYRRDYKPLVLVCHCHGVLQNDELEPSELNYTQASVHVESLVVRTMLYAAGMDLKRTVTANTETSEFSNTGVQVNQPEAVIQAHI